MRLILHVGLHKTGTSSIQKSLARIDGRTLRKSGYVYPVFSNGSNNLVNHSAVFYSMFTENPVSYHMNIRWGFNTREKVQALNTSYKQQLEDVFKAGGGTVIVSGEDISSLSLNALLSLKQYLLRDCFVDKIEVVCATRENISFLNSAVQEMVKNGGNIAGVLPSLSEKVGSLYSKTLGKLETVFGRDNIQLYKFEDSAAYSDGVFQYFVNNFLPAVNLSKYEELRSNEGLSHEAVELLSYINERLPLFDMNAVNSERKIDDTLAIHELKGSKVSLKLPEVLHYRVKEDQRWLRDYCGITYEGTLKAKATGEHWSTASLIQANGILLQLNSVIRSLAIEFFRDKAVELESENIQLANEMMLIAKNHRPNGPFISKKLAEYKRILTRDLP